MNTVLKRSPVPVKPPPEHQQPGARPVPTGRMPRGPSAAETRAEPRLAPPYWRWPATDTMPDLGAYDTAPGIVRSHVVTTLTRWGLMALADTAEVVASELVTNASQALADPATACAGHPNGRPRLTEGKVATVAVRLRTDGAHVLIEVWDPDNRMPAPANPDLYDESGRGLMIVGLLADDHGCDRHVDGGKVSWALLRSPGDQHGDRPPADSREAQPDAALTDALVPGPPLSPGGGPEQGAIQDPSSRK